MVIKKHYPEPNSLTISRSDACREESKSRREHKVHRQASSKGVNSNLVYLAQVTWESQPGLNSGIILNKAKELCSGLF